MCLINACSLKTEYITPLITGRSLCARVSREERGLTGCLSSSSSASHLKASSPTSLQLYLQRHQGPQHPPPPPEYRGTHIYTFIYIYIFIYGSECQDANNICVLILFDSHMWCLSNKNQEKLQFVIKTEIWEEINKTYIPRSGGSDVISLVIGPFLNNNNNNSPIFFMFVTLEDHFASRQSLILSLM